MLIVNPLNESSLAFPILECVHIIGFVCGVGTIALVNFRLLGVGLTQKSAAQLWKATMPWTIGGLSVAITAGLLLFSINPDVYFNRVFLLKMSFLVLALLSYYTAVRRAASVGKGRLAACVSLGLWTLVLTGGIFIGFFDRVSSFLHGSADAYPVILAMHVVALALFGGMIIVTDLRLLGLGMRGYSVSEVVNGLRNPKRFGFVAAAISGALLLAAKSELYSHNPWFWIKLTLLVLVAANYVVFRRSVYASAEAVPSRAKSAAILSLLLWTGAACVARGPATIKDMMHSMVDPAGDFLFKSVQQIANEQGVTEIAPRSNAQWEDVRNRLLVLHEVPNRLTEEGRKAARPRDRSNNPEVENEPVDVQRLMDADRSGFVRRARRLQDAASLGMKAVDSRDTAALSNALDSIDKACESCHLHYWYPNDKRAQEAAKADGITD